MHFNSKRAALHLLIILSLLATSYIVKIHVYRANAALGIDFKNNPKVLIVGDSRAANGLNPEHIMSSVNIAQGAEGVEFSYFKIMKAIESNSSIDTVLLAFSYHNLYDNFIEKGIIQRYHLIVNDQYYYDHFGYQSFSLAYVLTRLYHPQGKNRYFRPISRH